MGSEDPLPTVSKFAIVAPPSKLIGVLVVAPLAVTVAKVSVSAKAAEIVGFWPGVIVMFCPATNP